MIRREDLEISTDPSNKMGGQHVSVHPGIEVKHIPTGIRAYVDIGSQYRNREIAIDMILAALTNPNFR